VRDLINAAERSIFTHRLLLDGQRVLVAVSGGLDSTVLLDVLHRLSKRRGWALVVAHFNHRLRKGEADADERFVKQLSRVLGLPFVGGRGNVLRFARTTGLSLEMAARQLRHEFLAKAAREHGINVVTTAHHADDQVELFLLRLLRGSGGGLSGMSWDNPSSADDAIRLVRPFLDQPKEALCRHAKCHALEFREDASNQSMEISRNRVRHELVPLLRKYEPAFAANVLRTMEIIGANEDFAKAEAKKWLKRTRRLRLTELSPAVQRQIIRTQLLEMRIIPGFEVVESLRGSPGRAVTVPPGRSISCDKNGVLRETLPNSGGFNRTQVTLDVRERAGRAKFNGLVFEWRILSRSPRRLLSTSRASRREWFDAGRVGDKVVLRHWLPGDRFQPIGMTRTVKLQDLFTNQKIPRERRMNSVVATTGSGEIFWVEGLRIGEEFKLRAETRRRLKWSWSQRKLD